MLDNEIDGRTLAIVVIVGLTLFTGGILTLMAFENVPAGHKGVIVKGPNGPDYNEIDEGWQFVNPFAKVEIVQWNTQTRDMADKNGVSVRSSDNLDVMMDVSLIYHIDPDMVAEVTIDISNVNDVIDRTMRNSPRNVAANYTGEFIGGEGRIVVEEAIRTDITATLANYHIVVEDFYVRDIDLPQVVEDAIEEKKASEQRITTAQNELEAALIQANASRLSAIIQAEGVANATIIQANASAEAVNIVMTQLQNADPNLNDSTAAYLTWVYLNALTDPNSNVKYVLVTDSDNGTPIMVSLEDE